jgi:LPXTG-site transpeptidase (sortase) family protein
MRLTFMKRQMKKILVSLLLIIIVGVGGVVGVKASHLFSHPVESTVLSAHTTLPTTIPTDTATSQTSPQGDPGIPQKLSIPKIGVTASVESVGLDSQNRMDVPRIADDVGWYRLGYKIGENGNAVIDGHLDKVTGKPAVFWNLSKLQSGDKIIVMDGAGKQFTYAVTQKAEYPYNNFPLQQVFGPASKPMLNLITCQGTWDKTTKNYSHRIVIYSQLME